MRLLYVVPLCFFAMISTAQATTLKIATLAPDGTVWMKELKAGAAEIKKRTEGRVKLRFYPGGVMGNDKSVLRKIRIGQLHGGAITGGGLAEIYPDSQVYSLPLAFRDYDEVDYVRRHMDKSILDGLREHGYVSFGLGEGGFAYLMSDTPITTIDHIRDHKVWAPEGDTIAIAVFNALGVSPIPLPLTDVLTGLQTGMIDTISASPMGAIALQWHTRVRHMTNTPLIYLYGTLIIKRNTFERLSPADQATVSEVMTSVFKKLDQINRSDNIQALDALSKQGVAIVTPTDEEKKDWQAAVLKTVEELTQKGVVSNTIADAMYNHLNDYRNGAH